ncbi:hypothetical protein FOXG_21421 [Fusarium oxysporum f. sp. lycopersici 4287]|uniref:Uncharacterized protein n=1 Tax=Fusarium oxysporum f. sp. lycopersici (strain 4287 / CBS 123668 / FGSC 9935 / NRRL 34936) TaxID=426428 RepID=A0A0J9VY07_FUSO4|nr:hypothetical protein FOXG_21421 [Fusarium oxysporum f. sp. lycopersici 4287]KNB15646.1 hypothetical protein FOXG_21421 [Fusarium oxysporum f. sp. lycopersici 4287]
MAIITRGHSAKLLSYSPRANSRRSTRAARPSPQPHNIKRKSQASRDLRKEAVRLARKEAKDYFSKITHDSMESYWLKQSLDDSHAEVLQDGQYY